MMRYGLLNPPPMGGGTTTVNVPTQATRTYDTTGANFGLNTPLANLTAGGPNVVGAPQPLGTLTSDIDGLELGFTSLINAAGGLIVIYANGSPIISWPVNPINMFGLPQPNSIPIKVLSGVTLTVAWACVSGSANCRVTVNPYQSSVSETITSWTCLGSTAAMNAQGALLTGGSPGDLLAWKPVGTVGAGGAKALAAIAMTADNSRAGSNSYLIDIGIGPTNSEAVLIPSISPRPRDTTTALNHIGTGVKRIAIPGSTLVSARAQTEAGTLPDNVNVQVVIGA